MVKQTVLGADPEASMAFGRWHGQIEQYLDQSGLAYTLVRPHSFMQNFLLSAQPVAEQGVLYGMTGEGRTSYSDTRDIAAVAAQVLTGPGHQGQRYIVTGPEALSAAEVAERLSAAIGRPVRYVDLPAAAFAQGLAGAGMPSWLVEAVVEGNTLLAAGFQEEVTDEVARVTGRPPRTFEEFAAEHRAVFGGQPSCGYAQTPEHQIRDLVLYGSKRRGPARLLCRAGQADRLARSSVGREVATDL